VLQFLILSPLENAPCEEQLLALRCLPGVADFITLADMDAIQMGEHAT
jgi:hypothetical protein